MTEDNQRPVTPPPRPVDTHSLQLTPDQVRQVEINRLRAKAKQRQREKESAEGSSSTLNENKKRPLEVTPAASTSPTAPKPLKRDSRLGKYFEYDLSKMVNSKGGFLVEDEKEPNKDLRAKERERERQRALQNLEPPMHLDPDRNPKCKECQSMDIDYTFKKIFGCLVCNKCKDQYPEKYSLLTKTECKEDYLLTDPELRDHELLPHLLKANPHKSTFANMMLFLRCQIEEFAWKKWGSPEELDKEWERRVAEKKKNKNKKFEESLKDLRRRTKEGIWQKRKDNEHKHVFSTVQDGKQERSRSTSFYLEQNMEDTNQVEPNTIDVCLDVEQLEMNLFRSKRLFMPTRARGVFGGQVISQAIVSATKSVDSGFGLHCYFLLSASPAVPIIYFVERLRDGRSYCTRSVKAVQNGKIIFQLLCSYHKPEPWHPSQQWPMPVGVPDLYECELEEDLFRRQAAREDIDERMKALLITYAEERSRGPIAVRRAKWNTVSEDGALTSMFWLQARTGRAERYEAPVQKCILAYMSDMNFNDLSCEDGLLYVVICPRGASGRAVVHGRLYSRTGSLVAVTSQEGVVRSNARAPQQQSKL
ncbi:hypothetical protein CONPUDRAFT_86400 [Coniophora puteana RWD-64-598 SS2]|uniref:DNA repair protein RAD14 n=1 Tax=Coniophora puteana (strain RWD-64-598) TaxID=741705 RepID=A0A5M3N546_CONPW|nr:uncharacterized protein CONPUDRAFT_86400 [Coniophora puteana RWD-64-598 SS2]EIW86428.1 hypothetical protein CONPUDRAFT_86400 [Coniophora puteana RWD-64-598 SS2]